MTMTATPLPTDPGARVSDTDPSPPLATLSEDRESELVGRVNDLFRKARQKRRPLVEQWTKNYQALRARRTSLGMAWKPNPMIPEIIPIVDAIIAWHTDQRPTFDVAPSSDPYSPFFEFEDDLCHDLRQVVRATWHVEDYQTEIEKVLWDGFTYGIGFFKSVWVENLHNQLGNALLRRVDPFALYVDPDAASLEQANYLIEARSMSEQELERRWPGAAARVGGFYSSDVDSAPNTLTEYQGGGSMPKANPGAISPSTTPRYGLPGQTNRLSPENDQGVLVLEAWLRTPKRNDDGDTYDCWRCVVTAGNRVLMDKMADELWSHGQHPYDRFCPVETGEMYGPAMVELLLPMQESINKLLQKIETNIWLSGDPVWVEDSRSGLQRTQITNKPGQRLTKNAGSEAGWATPPQLDRNAPDLIRFYIGEMERVSGLSAVVRGATPTGRNAQGVIDAVQEAAFVRIRKSVRNLETTLGKASEKLASLIVEFYDTPRFVAIVGPSGEKSSLALRSNHFYVPSPEGLTPMRFQLLVQAGSAMATARETRVAEADTLFAMGAIDTEAVLEAHDFPNRRLVTQRVEAAKQAQMFQPPTQRAAARR